MKVLYLSLLIYIFQLPIWIIFQATRINPDMAPLVGNLLCLFFLIWRYDAYSLLKNRGSWSLKKSIALISVIAFIEIAIGVGLVALLMYASSGFSLEAMIQQKSTTNLSLSLMSVINLIVVAPVLEEILFRGILLDYFKEKHSEVKANWMQAFAFSITHFSLYKLPGHFLSGALYGFFRRRSQSIHISLGSHMVSNAIVCLALLWIES